MCVRIRRRRHLFRWRVFDNYRAVIDFRSLLVRQRSSCVATALLRLRNLRQARLVDCDLKLFVFLDSVNPVLTIALLPQILHVIPDLSRHLRNIQPSTHLIKPLKAALTEKTFVLLLLKRLSKIIQSLPVLTLVKTNRLV